MSAFNRDLQGFVRPAQRMFGSRLILIPNEEWKDYNTYEIEDWPGLQLKVYYHAAIHYLWRGRPIPTQRNSEEERYLMLKYGTEAPLPWVALSPTSIQEALAWARSLDKS